MEQIERIMIIGVGEVIIFSDSNFLTLRIEE